MSPPTSNAKSGDVVPIPTLPVASIKSLLDPFWIKEKASDVLVPKRTSLLALSKSLTVLFANEKSITPSEPILTASVLAGLNRCLS
jgi:hypothetical protein